MSQSDLGPQEWYAKVSNEVRKGMGAEPPVWADLSREEVRAWMLAFAASIESTMRMLDAMELTFPDLARSMGGS